MNFQQREMFVKVGGPTESYIKTGLCVQMKPCGAEAACIQVDEQTYKCICPQDNSQPTEDMKCPKRRTVPIIPKSFMNLSINKDDHHKPLSPTLLEYTTSQPIRTTFNQTTSFSTDQQFNLNILGFMLQINLLMLLAVGVAVIMSLVLVLAVCWSRTSKCCRKRKTVNNRLPVVPLVKGVIQEDCYALNPQYASPQTIVTKETILIPQLDKNNISAMEEIGQGYFGKVYKAVLRHSEGKYETVAIKVLKDHNNQEAKEDFFREVEIMTYFRHQNIVKLIGICFGDAKSSCPWMLFEFMAHGDLTEVLRNNSLQLNCFSPHLPILDPESLSFISLQIAAGMKYLATQRFVHRDLACRNCLVGTNLRVKIADFGMSRDIYTCDYYRVGGSRLLPVRWMSPESVVYGKFTLESDVWSFGVVLWEIYSLGKQPYYGYSNEEVLKLIHDGVLLDIPLDCPPSICVVMNGCWKSDPKERLKFTEIHERLRNMTRRPELDSPLPRPPALPTIMLHLDQQKSSSEEIVLVEEDDDDDQIYQSRDDDDQIYQCGDRDQIYQCGDEEKIYQCGDEVKIYQSGDEVKIYQSGDDIHVERAVPAVVVEYENGPSSYVKPYTF